MNQKSLGKSALIEGLLEETVYASNIMRACKERLKNWSKFLVDQMQDEFIKRQIRTQSRDAVNHISINQNDVSGFQILVPAIGAQLKYEKVVFAPQYS